MMRNFYLFLPFIFISHTALAQTLIEDGKSSVEIRKTQTNSKMWEITTSRYTISAGDKAKKIQIRIKLESQTGDKEIIDPNKFYILNDKYKIRLRPVDLKYPSAFASVAFVRLVKDEVANTGNTGWGGYSRDPSVPDTFKDYKKAGYRDVEITINFGTEKKPRIRTVYYKPNDIRNSLIDIYFTVPKNLTIAQFYYGDIKISDIIVE